MTGNMPDMAHARCGVCQPQSMPDAGNQWQTEAMAPRFLPMPDVAEELSVSLSQVYHMVRSGELPAIKVGGRGQWRIERSVLEDYIQRKYAETAAWVKDNPLAVREEEVPPA